MITSFCWFMIACRIKCKPELFNMVVIKIQIKNWVFLLCPGGASGKEPACQCRRLRDGSLIPGSGRSSGEGHGNPLQNSCLKNPLDRGAWWAMVYGVVKSWTQLKWLSKHAVPYFKCWIATCDYPIGQHKYRTFSPLQKSLLDNAHLHTLV